MQKLQIFVYKCHKSFGVGLLRHPWHQVELLSQGQQGVILTPPLPSSQAYEELRRWNGRFRGRWRALWWFMMLGKERGRKFPCVNPHGREGTSSEVLRRVKEILQGRLLSEHRLVSALRLEGFWPSDISRSLDLGVHTGDLLQYPGFRVASWGRYVCSRCQSDEVKEAPCIVCGNSKCLLCLACRTMGEHRSCTTLLALASSQNDEVNPREGVQHQLAYSLTDAQEWASQELLKFWEEGKETALVWAACGAGKTEVTFALIERALREGGEVLFAIPRQDIVREMAERLRLAFPGVTVASHYGGQPWLAPGNLVVATTHQVLHFHRRFQLAILDEVDAFPYQGNEMLRQGLQRALVPRGKLVEMTATPANRHKYDRVITIPARYHGFALPVPELVETDLPPWHVLESSDLPSFLKGILRRDQPWLVFAPTIAACCRLQAVLAEALDKPIGLCHSKAEQRSQVVQALRDGKLDIVVTTSVLERGVNFPGVGVIVLYADHGVFTVSALVQIAGRVGRTAEYPQGTVIFAGSRLTGSMKKAQKLIRELNGEARERGLLYREGAE
jgi:competence protein ComFA